MLYSPVFTPLYHGAAGILDELLLFGAPLVAVIIILVIASRRARKNAPQRERTRDPQDQQPPTS
jgi:ABC-type cobalt transport system substrate-binding protein